MEDAARLAPLALVVMVVDLLESTSIARALAAKCKYELNANQVSHTDPQQLCDSSRRHQGATRVPVSSMEAVDKVPSGTGVLD